MRLGFLGRLSDLPLNGQMLGSHPGIASELHRAGHPAGGENFIDIIGGKYILQNRRLIP